MWGNISDKEGEVVSISVEDLCEYAGDWTEAEKTKLWAEEQIKAIMPPCSELHVGCYLISRGSESIKIRRCR